MHGVHVVGGSNPLTPIKKFYIFRKININKMLKKHFSITVTIFSTLVLFSVFSNYVLASNALDMCKQIIVVGDVNWPPYAMQEKKDNMVFGEKADEDEVESNKNAVPNINGIGIEIVKKIFAELDIPVQVVQLDNRRNIFNGLHLGDIDILVSTYANKSVEGIVDIIEAGYLLDPIAIYMRKGNEFGIERWDDLIGKRGVMTDHFLFDSKFEDYINRYLYIHARGNLDKVLSLVNDRKADYVIGSKLQLEHGVKQAGLQQDLKLLEKISHPDDVHMGYSKKSLCRTYLPYLRKRLIDFKKDGTIEQIVAEYLQKNNDI